MPKKLPVNPLATLSAILSVVMAPPNAAKAAMPIQVYERMSGSDQGDYIGVMISGAERLLAYRPDLVAQIKKLFTTRMGSDDNTIGMVELEMNIAALNRADAENLVKDPNAKPLAVEIAMIATLKANGIILPKSFMHVGDDFEAKDRLSPPPKFGLFAQCFAYRHGTCTSH